MDKEAIEETPVFVRGMSRSGGTLMVAMLDAHPRIAMSYELYPELLKFDNGNSDFLASLADRVASAKDLKAAAGLETDYWRKFVLRCPRGGLNQSDLVRLLHDHLDAGMDYSDEKNRLQFIARCARLKMFREDKQKWGLKSTNNFQEYLRLWPRAKFLFMIRDGRDMLASQMNVGSFKTSPEDFARSWISNLESFERFFEQRPAHIMAVKYEMLVQEPEPMLREICAFLGLEYSDAMRRYHERDNTLFRNPTGHLSFKQLTEGINGKSLGRWRDELKVGDLETFMNIARPLMKKYGYHEDAGSGGC